MLAMLALVVLAACLRECRASDDEDGGAESVGSVGSSLILGLAVVWKDVKPRICRLCGEASDSVSPLIHDDVDEAPRRPWMRYKTCMVDGISCRQALGRICLICWNAFRISGLEENIVG